MDKSDYDHRMESLLSDRNTYESNTIPPFHRIERELNAKLLSLKRQQKIEYITYQMLHSVDANPLAIRGSIKHNKEGNPIRPTVTCVTSALYNTSNFLKDILSPLPNRKGYSVSNSLQFSQEILNTFIHDDEVVVSFYKQIHSYAMGSPVSPVVPNLCMEEIEKPVISASQLFLQKCGEATLT